ncbi:MAG: sigma-54 dependent transcriptional regulator [Bacteroidales bacterium]|jgi:two-component system response regulator AtoC|nr:sigma-54 dependent transcriptional regulator [Bacteroidales bacterium]
MEIFKIFVIEDDSWYGEIIKYHLTLNPEWEVELFQTGKEAIDNLHKKPSVVTLDYSLPDMSGMEVLKRIKDYDNSIPVIMISGQEDIETAVDLLQEGAYDYIVKNDGTKNRIWNAVKNIRESLEVRNELETLKQEVSQKYSFSSSIIGQSPAITRIFKLIEKATKTNINVSISGETGTGKELVAKAIHYSSAKKNKPFVPINMSAIPKELIESELFGHEKGAFTGANSRRIGKFEEAKDGTLFLDEIGDLDINMQTKLLRTLQEREIVRVGGSNTVNVKAKIIIATHKDLAEEVRNGNFREDLYFRLQGLPIHLAPLRERGEDTILLSKHFVKMFCNENNMKTLTLTNEAQKKLLAYPFPGNIRELKSVIDLSCVMANDGTIEDQDITFSSVSKTNDFLLKEMTLNEYNKQIISSYLNKYNSNVLLVAKKLGIGKSTIYRMIQSHDIELKKTAH